MKLIYKEMQTPDGVRSAYIALPDMPYDEDWKSSSITVLREDDTEVSVLEIIETAALKRIIDEQKSIIAFPNPLGGVWHGEGEDEMTPDEKFISIFSSTALPSGIYSEGWRVMGDVHYLVGLGSGATLVNILAALYPTNALAAAICTVGGEMPVKVLAKATGSPIPAYILNGSPAAIEYYTESNGAKLAGDGLYVCSYNKLQKVRVSDKTALDAEAGQVMWDEFFHKIRRTNTTPWGDVDRRLIPEECGFEWHIKDKCLGDNGGLEHSWIEAVPSCVKKNPDKKVPLILFSHGMSDNPLKAADMIKLHEVGEREGFITVYTFSSDRYKWNLSCDPALASDVDYYLALINYLKAIYPIDETRVYTSGFSNGAGMAMIFAMSHPELIAATCPVDSTFPYAAMGRFRPGGRAEPYIMPVLKPGEEPPQMTMPREDPEKNLAPLKAALKRQKEKRYVMPVMYFYGTREGEYPIGKGSNQELQYNFWKEYNNITIAETTDNLEPDAVGVAGQKVVELRPSAEHPDHVYTQHVFFTNEPEPKDYYNFMLMHGKAHEVHPAERELGWAFVSRFSRNADGSLIDMND